MITERLRHAIDRATQLSPDAQDALADALEQAITTATEQANAPSTVTPATSPDVREAFEQVMQRHAASLAYLKDR